MESDTRSVHYVNHCRDPKVFQKEFGKETILRPFVTFSEKKCYYNIQVIDLDFKQILYHLKN